MAGLADRWFNAVTGPGGSLGTRTQNRATVARTVGVGRRTLHRVIS